MGMIELPADLETVRAQWDTHAHKDPMWAALQQTGGWDHTEFFAHGQQEIDAMMLRLDEIAPDRKKRDALDFGCGIGRCTEALSHHYQQVHGVDISQEMIQQAETLNPRSACVYHVNGADLSMFRSRAFDLIYSANVLQHMPPSFALAYIAEFARTLRPKGFMLIEVKNADYRKPTEDDIRQVFATLNILPLDSEIPNMWLAQRA